jgi:hypothetical protein
MKLQEEQNDAELKKQHNFLSPLPRYYVFLSFTAFDALPYPTAKYIIGVLLFGAHLSACQIHKPSCYCCKLKRVFVCMKQQSQASLIHLIQDHCDVLCTHVHAKDLFGRLHACSSPVWSTWWKFERISEGGNNQSILSHYLKQGIINEAR